MCWFCSRRLRSALGVLACGAAFGQNAASKLEFEATSVKRSQPPANGRVLVGGRGGPDSADPGRVVYSFMPLKSLLAIAYGLKQYQISGPGWLETERYDIVATIPDGTSKAQFPMMLQTLLTDRFGIELHHETRELPLYELSVAKNAPKLKPPAADPNARPGASRMSLTPGGFHLEGHAEPASHSAVILEDQLASVSGTFDFTLDFSRESVQNSALAGLSSPPPANPLGPVAAPAGDPTEAPGLFTAVQEQLGLKLDKKRGPLDVIVLDRAEKVPKED